jgi:hypothetical protein
MKGKGNNVSYDPGNFPAYPANSEGHFSSAPHSENCPDNVKISTKKIRDITIHGKKKTHGVSKNRME